MFRFSTLQLFAIPFLATLAATLPAKTGRAAGLDKTPAPLRLSIAIPRHHDQRSLNDGSHFHVLLTNVSKKPVRVWTDRFSWGYDNLFFEVIAGDGTVTQIKKKSRVWTKNYPDWLELQPGESYVLNVDWSSDSGRGVWENLPTGDVKERPKLVKMRAVYLVREDDQSRKLGVWSGKIMSPEDTYALW